MVRWDKTEFLYDIVKKVAEVPTFQFTEKSFIGGPMSPEDGGALQIMVWQFKLPPPGTGTRCFVRLQDFEEMLDLKRADETDSNFMKKSWDSWNTGYIETFETEQFPGIRLQQSQAAKHKQKKALLQKTTLEKYAWSPGPLECCSCFRGR